MVDEAHVTGEGAGAPSSREIFEITRLADFMTIADTEDGAVGGAEGGNHA